MRRLVIVVAAIATLSLMAPSAQAQDQWSEVSGLTVEQGMSWGSSSNYGTGCTYTISARTSMPLEGNIIFTEDGQWIGSVPVVDGSAHVAWTPTTTGEHKIYAFQSKQRPTSVTVDVGRGLPIGGFCFVLPAGM